MKALEAEKVDDAGCQIVNKSNKTITVATKWVVSIILSQVILVSTNISDFMNDCI